MTRALILSLVLLAACENTAETQDSVDPVDPTTTDPGDTPDCIPSAEICDGLDNDCDGQRDEDPTDGLTFFADADVDGFGDAAESVVACEAPDGFVDNDEDCDDTLADVNPGAIDVCDGVDHDCDPTTGLATLFTEEASVDFTADLAGTQENPALVVLDTPGTLAICEGTHFARFDVQADVNIEGVAGSALTVIDGGRAGTVVDYTVSGLAARLDGLTLQRGLGPDAGDCQAGGICVRGTTLEGSDLVVRDHESTDQAGAMLMLGGTVTLTDTEFVDNVATGRGGAIMVRPNGRLTITDSRLASNEASEGAALFQLGGASRTVLERVDVEDNLASGRGGALTIDNGDFTVRDSTIANNTGGNGGGVRVVGSAGVTTIENTVIEGNTAARGAALFMTRSATLAACQVSGNTSTEANNAAVVVDNGTLTLDAVDFEDATGLGNTPFDLKAGDDLRTRGLGVTDTCTNAGCASSTM